MSKFVKSLEMDAYRKDTADSSDLLVVNVVGLEAVETNQLRLGLRKQGIGMRVVKNALIRKVLDERGQQLAPEVLEGPSAVVWGGEDIVGLAREITEWAKKIEKFVIKGGCVAGVSLDSKGVEQLSKLPSRVELLGQIVTLIRSPGSNLSAAMLGPGGVLAGQIKQIGDGETSESPAEAASA